MRFWMSLIGFMSLTFLFSQHKTTQKNVIEIASASVEQYRLSEDLTYPLISFKEAQYLSSEYQFLPYYVAPVRLSVSDNWEVVLKNVQFEEVSSDVQKQLSRVKEVLKETVHPVVKNYISQKKAFYQIELLPFIYQNGQYLQLVYGEYELKEKGRTKSISNTKMAFTNNSLLASGDWYKIGVPSNGMYRLTKQYFIDHNIDISGVDPRKIRVFGYPGGQLPADNQADRYDDMRECAVFFQGESDGVFNDNDFLIFYGEGPVQWELLNNSFFHQGHLYSDTMFYFLNIGDEFGIRVQNKADVVSVEDTTIDNYTDYVMHENDWENLLKSGNQWFGEYFDIQTTYNFSFPFANVDSDEPLSVRVRAVARSTTSTGNHYQLFVNNNFATDITIGSVPGSYYSDYVKAGSKTYSLTNPTSTISVGLTYNKPIANSFGWLDYIELVGKKRLVYSGGLMAFRNERAISNSVVKYEINNTASNPVLWNVTDPTRPEKVLYSSSGSTISFLEESDELNEYVLFTAAAYKTPAYIGAVANQNLHATAQVDYIIVSPGLFRTQAERLGQFHEEVDGLSYTIVSPKEIYNEFSSGTPDPIAIRSFVKMLYDRAADESELPRYLLLFGDGSYDAKNRIEGNVNFIPTYQSPSSFEPTTSYVSDDYFGLLDDEEGVWEEFGTDMLDIGVGRFPVQTVAQATEMVDKTIRYSNGASAEAVATCTAQGVDCDKFGDWRNKIVFIADDEDDNIHMEQADYLAGMVDTMYQNMNIQKIYLDAYVQESASGGERYPEATKAVNDAMRKGALIINYTGHGGEAGWAHERLIEVEDVNNWSNACNMPLVMTATCEFGRFDDPERVSAGELAFLNANGGSIALFTTVRLVFSGPNFKLNQNFYNELLPTNQVEIPRLGDIFMRTKVASGSSTNNRNFTLLGDPALVLAYPKYHVETTLINNVPVGGQLDTLNSLSKVTIQGRILDENNVFLDAFSGVLTTTVYDKPSQVNTLNNDNVGVFSFSAQNRVVYKGKSTVENGVFSLTFIVPKDIAYNYGNGRISYYVYGDDADGAGYFEDVVIGGSSDSTLNDQDGPEIELYINDENFVFGGTTDESPVLIANLTDSSGINTAGNGIGHDVVAILDEETSSPYVLNEYYESDLDSYQSGTVNYSFENLEDGRHTLKLKVWDVNNNSSESYTEFVVAEKAELALNHVLNYPNPFTTRTAFYFEHNQSCEELMVQVQIFTVSGKLIKTINESVHSSGFRSDGIVWDGKDDFNENIGRGVYVYKLKVTTVSGETAEKLEKLVILK